MGEYVGEEREAGQLIFPLYAIGPCASGGGGCHHSWLKSGEDQVTVEVQNGAGSSVARTATVLVDTAPPSGLRLERRSAKAATT